MSLILQAVDNSQHGWAHPLADGQRRERREGLALRFSAERILWINYLDETAAQRRVAPSE